MCTKTQRLAVERDLSPLGHPLGPFPMERPPQEHIARGHYDMSQVHSKLEQRYFSFFGLYI